MADQFCRIVDTTLRDCTLGSDGSQVILTTDANTSYVIRDVFQKNSCSNSKLTMTGSLEMDGVTISSGITSGVSGSLIIPPSSTVCYVESSDNYPLNYNDIYIFPDVRTSCNNNCKLKICECQVNGLPSGTVSMSPVNLTSYWGTVNACDFYDGGMWAQAPENCNYIIFCSDGNSVNTIRIFCCSGTAGCMCCSLGYCTGQYKDGMFMWGTSGGTTGCYRAFLPHCYQACCTYKCCMTLNYAHCYPTTYSAFGLSSRVNNDFNCRLVAMYPGQDCYVPVIVSYIDWTNCCHKLVYCHYPAAQSDCWCNGIYASAKQFHPFVECGVPYLLTSDSNTSAVDIASFPTTNTRNVSRYSLPADFSSKGCMFNVSNGRLWNTSTCCANACTISVGLSDLMANQSDAEVTVHAACDTSGCFLISSNGMTAVYYQQLTSVTPTDFDINPSTKLAIYGIKST